MELLWMARILSLIALVMIAHMFWKNSVWVGNRYFTIMVAIGLLYPLGKALQFWLIGPGWLRWYLGDIGWTSCVTVFIAFSPWTKSRRLFDGISTGVHTAFFIAATVELSQMMLQVDPANRPAFSAAGDDIDMVIFLVMYWVNIFLLSFMCPPAPVAQEGVPDKKRQKEGRKPRATNRR